MNVILLVLHLFVVVNGLSDDFRALAAGRMESVLDDCKAETGITDEELHEMLQVKKANTKSAKCLQACMMEHMGMMKDGVISREGTTVMLEPIKHDDSDLHAKLSTVMGQAFDEVEAIVDANKCEYAEKVSQIIQRIAKEHNIDPEGLV